MWGVCSKGEQIVKTAEGSDMAAKGDKEATLPSGFGQKTVNELLLRALDTYFPQSVFGGQEYNLNKTAVVRGADALSHLATSLLLRLTRTHVTHSSPVPPYLISHAPPHTQGINRVPPATMDQDWIACMQGPMDYLATTNRPIGFHSDLNPDDVSPGLDCGAFSLDLVCVCVERGIDHQRLKATVTLHRLTPLLPKQTAQLEVLECCQGVPQHHHRESLACGF